MKHNIKTVVTISRYWNNPNILVTVSDEHISLDMPIEDFIKAMSLEIRHPLVISTRTGLEKQMLNALKTVLSKTKESSAQVV